MPTSAASRAERVRTKGREVRGLRYTLRTEAATIAEARAADAAAIAATKVGELLRLLMTGLLLPALVLTSAAGAGLRLGVEARTDMADECISTGFDICSFL